MGPDQPGIRPGGRGVGLQDPEIAHQLADVLFPDPLAARDRSEEPFDIDLLLEPVERRQGVLAGRGGRGRVNGAVGQLEDGPLLFGEQADGPRAGQDQARLRGVFGQVGRDVVPNLVTADVPDHEHHVRQGLVEFERLDVEPDAGQDRFGHGPDPGVVGVGGDPESERQGQEKAAEPEEDERPGQAPRTDAERAEGDDLRVGRKTGQPAEDAHQDGHGQGEDKDGRNEEAEDPQGHRERHALGDEQVGQEKDLVHQKHEGDEQKPDQERGDHLADHVAVDDLGHPAAYHRAASPTGQIRKAPGLRIARNA